MSSKKSALGRGLGALLPSQEDTPDTQDEHAGDAPGGRLHQFDERARMLGRVAQISVESIRPNPYQPRQKFDEDTLQELADSIEELGIIQPITVRAATEEDGSYEIISGERRLRAARLAKLERIPAYVRDADAEGMLEMALVENVQREQLNPMEVALGYQQLIDECDLTQAAVAQKVGKGRATVANFLRLLKLPPKVQLALRNEELSAGHARALLSLDDTDAQSELLEEIIKKGLSVRAVEERVRNWGKQEEPKPAPEPPEREKLQLKTYTDKLRSVFSTKVKITRTKDGSGQIQVAYYSDDDLERLMEALLRE